MRNLVATVACSLVPFFGCGGDAFKADEAKGGSGGRSGPSKGGGGGADAGGSVSGGESRGGSGVVAGGSDSGGDAALAGAGGAGPSFEECPEDALICESFDQEWGAFEPFVNRGAVSRDDALVFRGQAAAKFETEAATPGELSAARLRAELSPPLKDGQLFVRFNAFVPGAVKLDSWAVIFEWAHGDGEHKVSFDFLVDRLQVAVPPNPVAKGGLIPRDRWFCVVLAADISDQGSFSAQIEGKPAAVTGGDVLPDGGVDHLIVGITTSPTQATAVSFSIDEFTAATTPLLCPPAD